MPPAQTQDAGLQSIAGWLRATESEGGRSVGCTGRPPGPAHGRGVCLSVAAYRGTTQALSFRGLLDRVLLPKRTKLNLSCKEQS